MFNFFCDNKSRQKDCYFITGADYNHIKNVLRMNIGDIATIRKSPLVTKLVRLKDRSFYDVINMKFKNVRGD